MELLPYDVSSLGDIHRHRITDIEYSDSFGCYHFFINGTAVAMKPSNSIRNADKLNHDAILKKEVKQALIRAFNLNQRMQGRSKKGWPTTGDNQADAEMLAGWLGTRPAKKDLHHAAQMLSVKRPVCKVLYFLEYGEEYPLL